MHISFHASAGTRAHMQTYARRSCEAPQPCSSDSLARDERRVRGLHHNLDAVVLRAIVQTRMHGLLRHERRRGRGHG